MGPTGSGKTTFVNLVSGSNFAVPKDDLISCTTKIQAAECNLDGKRVVLVDTPGFNDTTQSDVSILQMIALYLQNLHGRLAGVLYFHPICDRKVGGAARKGFNVVRKICGDEALPNLLFVTNMWEEVTPDKGQQREEQLKQSDLLLKHTLKKGAKIIRHHGNRGSAEEIIRSLLENPPRPFLIQQELAQGKDLIDTSAAMELSRPLEDQMKEHQAEERQLTADIEQAGDETRKSELEAGINKLRKKIKDLGEKIKELKVKIKKLLQGFALCKQELNSLKERLFSETQHLSDTEAVILVGVASAVILAVLVALAVAAPVALAPAIAIITLVCTEVGVFTQARNGGT